MEQGELARVLDVTGVVRLEGLQRVKLSRGIAGAVFELAPWREADGGLRLEPLKICLRAHYRSLDSQIRMLHDLKVVNARIRYDPVQGMGLPLSSLQPASDAELLHLLPVMAASISIVDETFGMLSCNRAQRRCHGTALWQGRATAVVALIDATLNPTQALKTLKRVWSQPQAVRMLARDRGAALAASWLRDGKDGPRPDFFDGGPNKVCADSHGNFALFFTSEGSRLQTCFRAHVADLPDADAAPKRRMRA